MVRSRFVHGRRFRLISAVAALIAGLAPGLSPATPRVPIAPAGAPALVSSNVSLLATVPIVGATGGRFAGGYFFTTASNAFPLSPGAMSGLYIFDASNPEIPVPAGVLPLPHFENEDVDVSVSRRLVLISQDNIEGDIGGILYVISWANPNVPQLLGFVQYPASVTYGSRAVGGPGHIVSCIADCARYAYVSGARNGSIFVIDLQSPASPSIAATVSAGVNKAGTPNAAFTTGTVHDVAMDPSGTSVWVTGSGGTAQLGTTNPLSPTPLRWVAGAANSANNQFIHHNALRLDASTVLVTEEDWLQPECGRTVTGEQGGFQTWKIESGTGVSGTLTFRDQWLTEVFNFTNDSAPAELFCSSHWFTFNAVKVAAVGWYHQGVRFLDVSDPTSIQQVGYFIAPGSMASGAYFAPGRSDIVWVADYQRGIDIMKITNGGASAPAVVAPVRAEWLSPALPGRGLAIKPSPAYGYACFVRRLPV